MFLKVFGSGQSDVRSGTSITTCCVVNANMDLGDPGNEYWITKHGCSYPSHPLSLLISRERCLELSNWMNVYKMFAFTAQHVVIEVPQRRRIAYLKTFKKISRIKHIAIPMTRASYKTLTWPEGFGASMVNRCAVVWCGRDFELKLHTVTLPCFALCRKTTPNKQRAAKRIKWPWMEPRLHRKSNNRPKFSWEQFISIFMPTLLVNNNIEFLIQSL